MRRKRIAEGCHGSVSHNADPLRRNAGTSPPRHHPLPAQVNRVFALFEVFEAEGAIRAAQSTPRLLPAA